MLQSYKMKVEAGLLRFPEELKEPFLETSDLPLRDGTILTPAELWHYLTQEAPRRYPYAFTASPHASGHLPHYVELLSSLKYHYLALSRRSRIEALRKQGCPLVYVQGGQTLDPYYAAGAIPMRPGALRDLACSYLAEGMDLRQRDTVQMNIHEEGNRVVSMEACHQLVSHAAIRRGTIPVDLLAPYTNLRCSDCSYLVESHRDSPRQTPIFLVDYPVNHQQDKPWAADYLAEGVRRLVQRLDELSGRQTSAEDLRAQIRLQNRIRRLARGCIELWWRAPAPPTYSIFVRWITAMALDGEADPWATAEVLEEMLREIKERAEHELKGLELAQRPVRIFSSGSCFTPNAYLIDRAGGAWVGWDDRWSGLSLEVAEEGDPYRNYAQAILASPYELPSEERARWVAAQARRARAGGLIFGHQWGCNFQSSVSRLICDLVKKETGLPTLILELDELGRGESVEQTNNRIEAFIEMLA